MSSSRRFTNLAAAIAKLSPRSRVLDGEVAIYDQQLRSRFDWLREPYPDGGASPPLFMAFDLLYQERRDLTARPLRDRRARLEDVAPVASWCSRCGGWRRTGWRRGSRSSSAGTRASRQGRGQRVRGRANEAVAEGQAERLDGRRGRLAAADQRALMIGRRWLLSAAALVAAALLALALFAR